MIFSWNNFVAPLAEVSVKFDEKYHQSVSIETYCLKNECSLVIDLVINDLLLFFVNECIKTAGLEASLHFATH